MTNIMYVLYYAISATTYYKMQFLLHIYVRVCVCHNFSKGFHCISLYFCISAFLYFCISICTFSISHIRMAISSPQSFYSLPSLSSSSLSCNGRKSRSCKAAQSWRREPSLWEYYYSADGGLIDHWSGKIWGFFWQWLLWVVGKL